MLKTNTVFAFPQYESAKIAPTIGSTCDRKLNECRMIVANPSLKSKLSLKYRLSTLLIPFAAVASNVFDNKTKITADGNNEKSVSSSSSNSLSAVRVPY